jgi:hypothetical protein
MSPVLASGSLAWPPNTTGSTQSRNIHLGTKLEARKVYPILNTPDRYNVDVSDQSRRLSEDSKKYNWGAKKLSLTASKLVHDIERSFSAQWIR